VAHKLLRPALTAVAAALVAVCLALVHAGAGATGSPGGSRPALAAQSTDGDKHTQGMTAVRADGSA